MAQIKMTMQALGLSDKEKCEGCKRKFNRGVTMYAVEYDDGSPAGWYCCDCIEKWKKVEG